MTRDGIALLVTCGAVAAALAGCGGPEHYGAAFSLADATPVAEILARPAEFEGRTVRVEGAIARECPSGCWFEVGRGTALLYVDLAPSGLAIPQRIGGTASVEGVVAVKDGQPRLIGRAVEIR